MVKLVALYTHPDDPPDFDRRFHGEQLPLVRALPGLVCLDVSRVTGSPHGDPPYYLMAELHFADRPGLDAALACDAGRRALRALEFVAGLATILLVEEYGAAGGPPAD